MFSIHGETWQRCTHGCGVQIQSFAEFKVAAGLAKGATKAQEWRIKIGGEVYWANTVPRCGGGTWKDAQLAAGDIEERPELNEGANEG
jgi:hypothetical protein